MLISIASGAQFAYIPNYGSNNFSVIDIATNNVKATINVCDIYRNPQEVAVTLAGTKIYMTNQKEYTVSVINITTNKVTSTGNVGQ